MTGSTGRIIGIVLLAFIVLVVAWPLRLLLFAPSAAFSGLFHNWPFHFERVRIGDWHLLGIAGLSLGALAIFAFLIAILVWVYRDAEKRGMNGVLWALVVFVGHLVGLVIYLIVRSDHPVRAPATGGPSPTPPARPQNCRQCGKMVNQDHAFCPYCGGRTEAVCPKCAKPIEKGWLACPSCGEKL